MSQCVPSWDIDDQSPPPPPRHSLRSHSNSTAPDVSMSDYEVAELTWENGHVAMHGLGLPRLLSKPPSWDKPRATGTLESIVNQATRSNLPRVSKLPLDNTLTSATAGGANNELVTWFDPQRSVATSGGPSNTVTMDALVPCRNNQPDEPNSSHMKDSMVSVPGVLGSSDTGLINGCSTRVGSCSAAVSHDENNRRMGKHAGSVARVPSTPEWSSRSPSMSGSATFGLDSQQVTLDTKGSDRDSACHSRLQREASDEERKKRSTGKSSVSTKRSRAAAIHNQSERKRRDKINQRMNTLQKLVPNSSKTDKASMLDEVIDYLKQLQAQVHVISRMNMPAMMLPMAMQQQLQMSMMAPRNMGMGIGMGMGMGMGMSGMGMDMNNFGLPNIAGVPPVLHPTSFMPMTSWDGAASRAERLQAGSTAVIPDPLSAFLACQSQPMNMEAYSMMAAMYQQFHHQQPAPSSSKS